MLEINILLTIAVVFFVFYDTEVFMEYSKLFRLKFTKYKEFYNFKETFKSFDYQTFLLKNYNNFFVRLITCPICSGVWVGGIVACVIKLPILDFGVFIIGVWLSYFGLRKVIKMLTE